MVVGVGSRGSEVVSTPLPALSRVSFCGVIPSHALCLPTWSSHHALGSLRGLPCNGASVETSMGDHRHDRPGCATRVLLASVKTRRRAGSNDIQDRIDISTQCVFAFRDTSADSDAATTTTAQPAASQAGRYV